jgi:hypothetical protein
MTSDDGSVKLTTYRVVYQTEKVKHQIMLEDFESYELKSSHIGNYKLLTLIFSILTLVILIIRINEYFQYPSFLTQFRPTIVKFIFMSFFFDLSLLLLFFSLVFQGMARRYYIRLNGKFDSIEIRITNPRKRSVGHFLQTLVSQSAEVRNETLRRNILG